MRQLHSGNCFTYSRTQQGQRGRNGLQLVGLRNFISLARANDLVSQVFGNFAVMQNGLDATAMQHVAQSYLGKDISIVARPVKLFACLVWPQFSILLRFRRKASQCKILSRANQPQAAAGAGTDAEN